MLLNRRNILILAGFVTCFSCATGKPELTEEQLALSEELASKFGNLDQLVYGDDTLMASKEVLTYYESKDFAPVWIEEKGLNENGEDMVALVENSMDMGFLPSMFYADHLGRVKDSSKLDAEMLLTNAFFLMISHINVGCIDSATYEYSWKKELIDFSLEDELDRVFAGDKPSTVIAEKQPKHWEYQQLTAGLQKYLDENILDTNRFSIPKFKDDSVKCYKVAREALLAHGFLDSTNYDDDSIFIDQLKAFQRLNGLKDDAIVGRWTSRALENSNYDRFMSAALSLEKWRWKADTMPDKYIRVNIPEFQLYFFDSTELKAKHRVIVGAQKTPTPEFSATMRRMVTNPVWHLPYSISSTEFVWGMRKDSAYARKKGYRVYKNGVQQDASTIDWTKYKKGNFPFKVNQKGGGGNSLGRLKFLFPNTNYVYIHDTPSKYLFKNDVRAYSHGCIRLHRPYELGKEILASEINEVMPDTLDSIIGRGRNRVIEFVEPFPVFLEYYTATGDSSGQVVFHPDIYGRDEKYVENSLRKFID